MANRKRAPGDKPLRLLARRAALCLALAASPASAQPGDLDVKAGFLPRFARYVSWPTPFAAGSPVHLCVVGNDPFGHRLEAAVANQRVDGHGFRIRRLAESESAGGCHIAFVQGADGTKTARLLLALRERPILTVTDARAGSERGMIHFTILQGRVRFFINQQEAAGRGLTISSRLLALAVAVTQRR